MEKKKNQPAHEIRLGCIRASIWPNASTSGRTWYTVTTSRAYKDGDGSWNDSKSFHDYDLPSLGAVLEQARAWIREQPESVTYEPAPMHAMDETGMPKKRRGKRRSK